jgi:hypothetical protein
MAIKKRRQQGTKNYAVLKPQPIHLIELRVIVQRVAEKKGFAKLLAIMQALGSEYICINMYLFIPMVK